jgi:hypothetical protein
MPPKSGSAGHQHTTADAFISGKSRINAVKALILTDERGRLLFCGEVRAGSVADITQARDADLVDLLADTIDLKSSPTPATRPWQHRPTAKSSHHPANAAACTSNTCNGSWPTPKPPASPTPQHASPSNTASPTSRTGKPWPATTPAGTTSLKPSGRSPDLQSDQRATQHNETRALLAAQT